MLKVLTDDFTCTTLPVISLNYWPGKNKISSLPPTLEKINPSSEWWKKHLKPEIFKSLLPIGEIGR